MTHVGELKGTSKEVEFQKSLAAFQNPAMGDGRPPILDDVGMFDKSFELNMRQFQAALLDTPIPKALGFMFDRKGPFQGGWDADMQNQLAQYRAGGASAPDPDYDPRSDLRFARLPEHMWPIADEARSFGEGSVILRMLQKQMDRKRFIAEGGSSATIGTTTGILAAELPIFMLSGPLAMAVGFPLVTSMGEGIMHLTDPTRSLGESAFHVGISAGFGVGFGVLHKMLSLGGKLPLDQVNSFAKAMDEEIRSMETGRQVLKRGVFTENLAEGVNVEIHVGPITKSMKAPRKDGSIPMAFRRTVDGKDVIFLDLERIKATFKDKPWRSPKVPGVRPLEKDFSTPDEWANFILEHEKAHVIHRRNKGESTADYENRINNIVLENSRLGATAARAEGLAATGTDESGIGQRPKATPNTVENIVKDIDVAVSKHIEPELAILGGGKGEAIPGVQSGMEKRVKSIVEPILKTLGDLSKAVDDLDVTIALAKARGQINELKSQNKGLLESTEASHAAGLKEKGTIPYKGSDGYKQRVAFIKSRKEADTAYDSALSKLDEFKPIKPTTPSDGPAPKSLGAAATDEATNLSGKPYERDFIPGGDENMLIPAFLMEKLPDGSPAKQLLQSASAFTRHALSYLVEHPWYQRKNVHTDPGAVTAHGVDRNVAVEWISPMIEAQKASDELYRAYRLRYFNENKGAEKMAEPHESGLVQLGDDLIRGRGGALNRTEFMEQITRAQMRTVRSAGQTAKDAGLVPEAIQAAKAWQEFLYSRAGQEAQKLKVFSIKERRRLLSLKHKMDKLLDDTETRGMTSKQFKFFEDMEKQAKTLEAEIKQADTFRLDPNYIHRIWNKVKIKADRGRFTAILMKEGGLSKGEAKGVIDEILTGKAFQAIEDDAVGVARSIKERTVNIDSIFVEDFIELNAASIGRYYATRMGADMELVRAFGSVDLKEVVAKIAADYDSLIAKIEPGFAKRVRKHEDILKALDELDDIERLAHRTPDFPVPRTKAGKEMLAEKVKSLENFRAIRDRIRGTYGIPDDPSSWTNRGI